MMDPIAVTYETCVVCQTQTTDPFRPTYCDHTFCKSCALVEMKSGRQRCRICKEPLHFLVRVMDQFRRPFKICPMRDYVMTTWYLVVACILIMVIVDIACLAMMVIVDTACLVTSGLTVGLVWPLLLLYLMVSIVIHTIAWVILLAFRAVMWISQAYTDLWKTMIEKIKSLSSSSANGQRIAETSERTKMQKQKKRRKKRKKERKREKEEKEEEEEMEMQAHGLPASHHG